MIASIVILDTIVDATIMRILRPSPDWTENIFCYAQYVF